MKGTYSEYIDKSTDALIDILSSKSVCLNEKNAIIDTFSNILIDNIGTPDSHEDWELIFARESVIYIDKEITHILSMTITTQKDFDDAFSLCNRQIELLKFFYEKKWIIPDIENEDLYKCIKEIEFKHDSQYVQSKFIALDETITSETTLAERSLSIDTCDSVLNKITELEKTISYCREKKIKIPRLKNNDLIKCKKNIESIKHRAEERNALYTKMYEVDAKLKTIINTIEKNGKNGWVEAISLCEQQKKNKLQCEKNHWTIPVLRYGDIDSYEKKYHHYSNMVETDHHISEKKNSAIKSTRIFQQFSVLCDIQTANLDICNLHHWNIPELENPEPKKICEIIHKQKEENDKIKKRKRNLITILIAITLLSIVVSYFFYFQFFFKYIRAMKAIASDSYIEAETLLVELKDFSDSQEKLAKYKEDRYLRGVNASNQEDYSLAIELLTPLEGYKDSDTVLQINLEKKNYLLGKAAIELDNYLDARKYLAGLNYINSTALFESYQNKRIETAQSLAENKKYDEALLILEVMDDSNEAVEEYKKILKAQKYELLPIVIENDNYSAALEMMKILDDYDNSNILFDNYRNSRIAKAQELAKGKKYSEAYEILDQMSEFEGAIIAKTDIQKAEKYDQAMDAIQEDDYATASLILSQISDYSNSSEILNAYQEKRLQAARELASEKNYSDAYVILEVMTDCEPAKLLLAEIHEQEIYGLAVLAVESKDYPKASSLIMTLEGKSRVNLFQLFSIEDMTQIVSVTNSADMTSVWNELDQNLMFQIFDNLPFRRLVEIFQRFSPEDASNYLQHFSTEKQAELLNSMRKTSSALILLDLDSQKMTNIINGLDKRLVGLYINQSYSKRNAFNLIDELPSDEKTEILRNVNLGRLIDYLWRLPRDERNTLLDKLNLSGLGGIFLGPGARIDYGTYVQNNSKADKIEWIILENTPGNMKLLSVYALDCMPYNNTKMDIDWQHSSLRKWLNDSFLKKAFSTEDLKLLVNTNNETTGSSITKDSVYLLSSSEVSMYLSDTSLITAEPTKYAKDQGADTGFLSTNTKWWLRDQGSTKSKAAAVHPNGSIDTSGEDVDQKNRGVRPAVTINFANKYSDEELRASKNDENFLSIYDNLRNIDKADYKSMVDSLRSISGYRDSDSILESYQNGRYLQAIQAGDAGNYDEALSLLADMFDYEDSEIRWTEYFNRKQYDLALAAIENNNYNDAIDILTGIIQYEDSKSLLDELQK